MLRCTVGKRYKLWLMSDNISDNIINQAALLDTRNKVIIATDGYCMAIVPVVLDNPDNISISIPIPFTLLKLCCSLCKDKQYSIDINLESQTYTHIAINQITITMPLIQVKYPNVYQVISGFYKHIQKLESDTSLLAQCSPALINKLLYRILQVTKDTHTIIVPTGQTSIIIVSSKDSQGTLATGLIMPLWSEGKEYQETLGILSMLAQSNIQ